jgi:thiol-disulfide isomerase/thioredoxin
MESRAARFAAVSVPFVAALLVVALSGCGQPAPPAVPARPDPPRSAPQPAREPAAQPALPVWPPPAPTSAPPAAVSNEPPPVVFPEIKADASDPARYEGRTLDEFVAAFGSPVGRIQKGGKVAVLYARFIVHSDDGVTVSWIEGGSPPPKSAPVSAPPKKVEKPAAPAMVVDTISNGGKRIDLQKILIPGKVTVIDFYAEWSGPCRVLDPHLEMLIKKDADVVLRRIDIINWQSEVAGQYEVTTLPSVRVYDRRGHQIGGASSSLEVIQRNVNQAKKP